MKRAPCDPVSQSARMHREKADLAPKYQVRCSSACACGQHNCRLHTISFKRGVNVNAAHSENYLQHRTERNLGRTNAHASGVRAQICQKKGCPKCIVCLLVIGMIVYWIHSYFSRTEEAAAAEEVGRLGFDPCCAFPCLHNGVCVRHGARFECDCTTTGYSGQVCEKPSWGMWLWSKVWPTEETLLDMQGQHPWLWKIVNIIPFLHRRAVQYLYLSREQRIVMPNQYSTASDYTTLDTHYNRSMYARQLPPIPLNCPTDMGTHGPKVLPSEEEVYERIFRRRHFIPCDHGTNVYFTTYAQFFTHQFFKTDYSRGVGVTYGTNEGVDSSNVYGQVENRRSALRSFKDGKLKTTVIDGEDVPPTLEECPNVLMSYPKGDTLDEIMADTLLRQDRNVKPMWAMGHPVFSMTPFLFVVATLWLREHNRVCDVLKAEHPDWDDERLYQTARLVITGIMVKMTLTEYVQHLSQYKVRITYEPELIHGTHLQYSNRIFQEFVHLYHWHMQVPDIFRVEQRVYRVYDLLFTNNSEVFENGFNRWVASMFVNIAGKITARNHGEMMPFVGKALLKHSRELRIQSFNNYRRAFDLKPYKDFMDLTGDPELASELRQLYGDVDAVEFYVGLLVEKHTYSVTPPSMVTIGGSWSVKGLISNPIGSPRWWKPSTFGGRKAWDIIKRTTLKDFVCRNLRGRGCAKMHVGYAVPKAVREAAVRHASQRTKAPRRCH